LNNRTPGFPNPIAVLLVGLGMLFGACSVLSPPPPVHGSPEATFRAFIREMEQGDFSGAYRYFSPGTRKRYKLNHFHGLMNRTVAGRLLQWKIRNWTIRSIQKKAPDRAYVIMGSPAKAERTSRYELVRTTIDGGPRAWRIRFFLADELGMPRADESFLFSPGDEE